MQSITYRERPLAYRRSINALLTLGTVGAIAWSIYQYRQSGGVDWDPFEIILVLIVWIGAHFVMRRASVTFDGRGLTYAIDGNSRHWAWSELSAPEIQDRDGQMTPYVRFRPERLDWIARLGWLGWRSRPEIRIPQSTYDAPLAEICARLNDYRDRAVAGDGAAAYVETDDRGTTIVVYRERANRGWFITIPVLVLICSPFVWGYVLDYRDSGTVPWDLWLTLPWLAVIFWGLVNVSGRQKGPSTLKLDDQGLTYAYGTDFIRRWNWAELSAPEFPSDGHDDGPHVRLRHSGRIDWVARLFMPGISLNGSEIRVRPVFDAPLTNIRTMLNEYRDRALGAKPVSPAR